MAKLSERQRRALAMAFYNGKVDLYDEQMQSGRGNNWRSTINALARKGYLQVNRDYTRYYTITDAGCAALNGDKQAVQETIR